MYLRELLRGIVEGVSLPDRDIADITNDSRKVTPDSVFVALHGIKSDGHDYAAAAAETGAVVLVERDLGIDGQILVPSTRRAWALMCANFFGRPSEKLHLIGVTGTNGKTTFTYLMKSLLEAKGHKVGLIGTIQNMIGDEILPADHTTPDAYELQGLFSRMAEAGCDYAVMELSSHALDQDRAEGCFFDVAVFTNLTHDHLDYHHTMEAYLAAKKRLFYRCKTAVINADDPYAPALCEGLPCPIVFYGTKDADCAAEEVVHRPDGVGFTLCADGGRHPVTFPVPGQFSVYNALAVGAAALSAGIPAGEVAALLGKCRGVKGRAEIVPTGRDFTVVIDYAHTPDGLENICSTMKECAAGRLVTLFGCGGDRDRTKRPEMGAIAARLSDFCIVTSDNPRTEDPRAIIDEILRGMQDTQTPYTIIENRVEAIRWAVKNALPGDTILLAGKGHETYQILADRTIHLDEREVVADALKEL